MSDKEKEPEQKEKPILKLFSNNEESEEEENSSESENNRKNNTNKNQKILNKKTYKEDNNSGFNNYNTIKRNSTKELNNQDINSSDISNEKEITIGKLYSYRRPYSKYRRKLIFILICIINILINCQTSEKFNKYSIRYYRLFGVFGINFRFDIRWIYIFNLCVKMGHN